MEHPPSASKDGTLYVVMEHTLCTNKEGTLGCHGTYAKHYEGWNTLTRKELTSHELRLVDRI